MSENLRYKLQIYRASKQVSTLLTSIVSVQFEGFVSGADQRELPEEYRAIYSKNAIPYSKILNPSSRSHLVPWLNMCLEQSGIITKCYLMFAEFGESPWAEVSIISSNKWLEELWYSLKSHSFLILSSDKTMLMVFLEQEYYYMAYIGNISNNLLTR